MAIVIDFSSDTLSPGLPAMHGRNMVYVRKTKVLFFFDVS